MSGSAELARERHAWSCGWFRSSPLCPACSSGTLVHVADHVVFVIEESDEDDPSIWTGLFSANCQGSACEPLYRPGKRMFLGPQRVPVEEAIAWGREHADIVWVRAIDSRHYYSAGTQTAPGDDVVLWPPDGMSFSRRRDPAMWYLDRTTADPPIRWAVTVRANLADGPAGFAELFKASVLSATGGAEGGSTSDRRLSFELDGRVRGEVEDAANTIVKDAMRATGAGMRGTGGRFGWQMTIQVEPAASESVDAP
jgi:hypothetical protein